MNKMATATPELFVSQQPPTVERFKKLRQELWATDVEIATKDGEIVQAHRVVLGAASPALKQQLEGRHTLDLSEYPKQ